MDERTNNIEIALYKTMLDYLFNKKIIDNIKYNNIEEMLKTSFKLAREIINELYLKNF